MKLAIAFLVLAIFPELFFHDVPNSARVEAQRELDKRIGGSGGRFPAGSRLEAEFVEYLILPGLRRGFLLLPEPNPMYSSGIAYTFIVMQNDKCLGFIRSYLKDASHIVLEREQESRREDGPRRSDKEIMGSYGMGGGIHPYDDRCEASQIIQKYPRSDGYQVAYVYGWYFKGFMVRDSIGSLYVVDETHDLNDYDKVRLEWLKLVEVEKFPEPKGRSN